MNRLIESPWVPINEQNETNDLFTTKGRLWVCGPQSHLHKYEEERKKRHEGEERKQIPSEIFWPLGCGSALVVGETTGEDWSALQWCRQAVGFELSSMDICSYAATHTSFLPGRQIVSEVGFFPFCSWFFYSKKKKNAQNRSLHEEVFKVLLRCFGWLLTELGSCFFFYLIYV